MSQNRAAFAFLSRRRSFLQLLAVAGLVVVGLALLLPKGPARPLAVSADACSGADSTGSLTINVSGQGNVTGFTAVVSPTIGDDGHTTNQADSYTVPITALAACATDTNQSRGPGYDVQLTLTGDASTQCNFSSNPSSGGGAVVSMGEVSNVPVTHGGSTTVTFYVTCAAPTATPGATATATGPSSVSVSTTSSLVGCGGSSFVSAVVKDGSGNPVPNVTVSFITSLGFVSSAVSTDTTGTALAIFTAPTGTSATASITASANGFSGGTSIAVDCQPSAPRVIPPVQPVVVAPPVVVAAPQQVSIPQQTIVISPPNTGDGGLAD